MWPLDHTFHTYTWPYLFGWIAHNTPGNLVAGFLQVGLAFTAGISAHRLGVTERIKSWATRDIHARHTQIEALITSLDAKIETNHQQQLDAHQATLPPLTHEP
jgi:hypothetical protein